MTKLYLSFLSCLLFFAACKTASKAYNKGDYADAIELGVKKLQKDPADAATLDLVKSAYGFAVNQSEATIRSLSGSSGDNRYEAILREYNRLQDLYETLHLSPVTAKAISPVDYTSYVETYRNKTADVHLASAERWMNEGTKKAYREAYNEYGYVLRYRNNGEIRRKRDDAYNLALTKILVVPIQNYGGYSYHSSFQLQQFQADVMRTLAYNLSDNFVRFYSDLELRTQNLEPDQVLELNLGRISIGRPYDQSTQREVSKEVVVRETVYKPDSVVKQYATVRAKMMTTRRTLLSEGELYLTLRDWQGRILWTDRFTGQHRWQTEFASFTGDERALSETDRSQLNRNNNERPPGEEEIMSELYRQIEQDLSSRLRGYFARF